MANPEYRAEYARVARNLHTAWDYLTQPARDTCEACGKAYVMGENGGECPDGHVERPPAIMRGFRGRR